MLLDRDGNEVAELHADVDRVLIPFAQMPMSLRHAVVAVEDADFYRHDGLDMSSVVRASWANVTSGSMSQGGSTITQQYVKNVLTGLRALDRPEGPRGDPRGEARAHDRPSERSSRGT